MIKKIDHLATGQIRAALRQCVSMNPRVPRQERKLARRLETQGYWLIRNCRQGSSLSGSSGPGSSRAGSSGAGSSGPLSPLADNPTCAGGRLISSRANSDCRDETNPQQLGAAESPRNATACPSEKRRRLELTPVCCGPRGPGDASRPKQQLARSRHSDSLPNRKKPRKSSQWFSLGCSRLLSGSIY